MSRPAFALNNSCTATSVLRWGPCHKSRAFCAVPSRPLTQWWFMASPHLHPPSCLSKSASRPRKQGPAGVNCRLLPRHPGPTMAGWRVSAPVAVFAFLLLPPPGCLCQALFRLAEPPHKPLSLWTAQEGTQWVGCSRSQSLQHTCKAQQ